jgi:hypothetical protein
LKNGRPEKGSNKKHTYPKYNIDSLQQDSIKFLYKLRLSAKLNIDVNQPPDTMYQALKTKIHEAAKEALGEDVKCKSYVNWWSEDLEEIVPEKRAAYQRWLSTKDYDVWRSYKRYCYMVKKAVTKSKSRAWENKCEEVDRCMGGTKVKEAWRVVKSLRKNTTERSHISPINMMTWRNYFQNLLTEERAACADILLKDEIPPTQGSFSFSEDEVQRHIQNI